VISGAGVVATDSGAEVSVTGAVGGIAGLHAPITTIASVIKKRIAKLRSSNTWIEEILMGICLQPYHFRVS
jgi:hypothetical protein